MVIIENIDIMISEIIWYLFFLTETVGGWIWCTRPGTLALRGQGFHAHHARSTVVTACRAVRADIHTPYVKIACLCCFFFFPKPLRSYSESYLEKMSRNMSRKLYLVYWFVYISRNLPPTHPFFLAFFLFFTKSKRDEN